MPNGTDAKGNPLFLTGNAIFNRDNEAITSNNLRSQAADKTRSASSSASTMRPVTRASSNWR